METIEYNYSINCARCGLFWSTFPDDLAILTHYGECTLANQMRRENVCSSCKKSLFTARIYQDTVTNGYFCADCLFFTNFCDILN